MGLRPDGYDDGVVGIAPVEGYAAWGLWGGDRLSMLVVKEEGATLHRAAPKRRLDIRSINFGDCLRFY